jgi:hypothetical protein
MTAFAHLRQSNSHLLPFPKAKSANNPVNFFHLSQLAAHSFCNIHNGHLRFRPADVTGG